MFMRANCFPCIISLALFLIFTIGGLNSGCAKTSMKKTPLVITKPLVPAKVRPEKLKPGLSVLYFYGLYSHIMNMPHSEKSMKKGKPGPPIAQLNHRFAKDVKVFDSGESQGVGMILNGYLHLTKPGKYNFQAKTNDGFELYLNDTLIISDPGVHGDRLSNTGQITVNRGGWFPLHIKYYQRKGTAALALYWQHGDIEEFSVIPPEIYGHISP